MGHITLRHFHHVGNFLKMIKWARSIILYVRYMYDNNHIKWTISYGP